MTKTAREWFAELPPHIEKLALANAYEESLSEKRRDLEDALHCSFVWDRTPEGNDFWENIVLQSRLAFPIYPDSGTTIPTPIRILIPSIETLIPSIEAWAEARGITSPQSQLLKFFEEGGELASALLKNKEEEEKDAVGDVLVTLIIYCKLRNINLAECLSLAWEQIKNRTGKTQGGIFVKDETDTATPIN
jgi:NTP pyrophosphatase (non-canonical NTP hydrolase)